MPWIEQVSTSEATGLLREQFDAALKLAGRVWHTRTDHESELDPAVSWPTPGGGTEQVLGIAPLHPETFQAIADWLK